MIYGGVNENYSLMLLAFGALTLMASLYHIIKFFDKKPKMILDENSIWINTKAERISWQNVIATFIKIEDRDEDVISYLVIHHYEYLNDTFKVVEFKLENLNMDIDEISFHIEKFKEKILHERK